MLGLLAEGHTAKSIAAATGTTVGAVNERLREARRKTGAGSSRELARALTQENWDGKMGVVLPGDNPPALPDAALPVRRWGKLLMFTAPLAAAALLVSFWQQPASPDPMTDPFTQIPTQKPETAALRQKLVAEGRDPAWAPATEVSVRKTLQTVVTNDAILRVSCGRTLCEVAGQLRPSGEAVLNQVMQGLQGRALAADLAALGLDNSETSFNVATGNEPRAMNYLQYWERK
jgi:hypothetical protein